MSCFANFENWSQSEIPGFLSFKYPTTLQVRQQSVEKMNTALANGDKNIRLQLIPNQSMAGNNARIDFRIRRGRRDTGLTFGGPINTSPDMLSQWQGEFLLSVSQELGTQVNLANPIEVFTFDGKSCTYLEYHYKLDNEPEWYVYVYRFFDKDKEYRVTMHVRSDQYKYWTRGGEDIRDIVKTLVPIH